MTPLVEARVKFTRHLPRLIDHVFAHGYTCTIGEVKRAPVQAEINAMGFDGRESLAQLIERQYPRLARLLRQVTGNGIRLSLHCDSLAVDIEIRTQDGTWVKADLTPYERAADFWKSLDPAFAAGIDWGDTPHYSHAWENRK